MLADGHFMLNDTKISFNVCLKLPMPCLLVKTFTYALHIVSVVMTVLQQQYNTPFYITNYN